MGEKEGKTKNGKKGVDQRTEEKKQRKHERKDSETRIAHYERKHLHKMARNTNCSKESQQGRLQNREGKGKKKE